jgi:hypothetical protein
MTVNGKKRDPTKEFLWILTSQMGVFSMRTRDLKRQFIRISSSQMGSQPSPTGISEGLSQTTGL